MTLPFEPPVSPMLAKAVSGLPEGDDLIFEPKWDGFRCIVFRDGDDVILGSRNERPMTRYFPELIESIKTNTPTQCVLDGEIIVITNQGLDFDALQQRIHPAASRINLLAEQTPSSLVVFDILALGDTDLRARPFAERRATLEKSLAKAKVKTSAKGEGGGGEGGALIYLTPATTDRELATRWFHDFEGAGLDGLIAKPSALEYQENKRVMFKVKHQRTADCVVAGFRWHKTGDIIGSLLLGLYDDEGVLHHVGITASFTMARRKELVDELAPYRVGALENHPWRAWVEISAESKTSTSTSTSEENNEQMQRRPGGTSRWNAKKDLSWQPLRPELVVEVAYDHLQGDRFRHATTFQRWRRDRDPASCTYDQLETATPMNIRVVLSSSSSSSSS